MNARKGFDVGFMALLLPFLVAVGSASAQDKPMIGSAATRSSQSAAPVGHRQPTAADVAKAQLDTVDPERAKRERALDEKLQICRGC